MTVAVAAVLFVAARAQGAYSPTAWGLLGLVLVGVLASLWLGGRAPSRAAGTAALALAAIGAWSVASVAWGGLPHEAWVTLDRQLLAAAALAVGAALATSELRAQSVVVGVLAAATAQASEILLRIATGSEPESWFAGRLLEGPVGYHNAQAAFLALALPLSLWLVGARPVLLRFAGGASAALLLGALLLTQSRAVVLVAAALGLAAQLLLAGQARLVLAAGAAAVVAPLLLVALRRVDAELLTGDEGERLEALRAYSLWVAAAAIALGAVWAILPRLPATRAIAAVATGALAAGMVFALVSERDAVRTELAGVSAVPDAAPAAAPGETRLTSLATNGRREAWRVAWELTSREPVLGVGQGKFATGWAVERRLADLYVLQPHSLPLELLSELGPLGVAALLLFALIVVGGLLRAADRRLAAAALGSLLLVLLQASVDWTWSFSVVVAGTLLVVGAALGPSRRRPRNGWAAQTAPILLGAIAMAAMAGPALATRHLDAAERLVETDPLAAHERAKEALALDPWLAPALTLSGRVAEGLGNSEVAADEFHRAAQLSQRPWLDGFREARALAAAGDSRASFAACRRTIASNPLENGLITGACRPHGSWPAEAITAGAAGGLSAYEGLFRDLDCASCRLRVMGETLVARVGAGADARDSAYAVRAIGPTSAGARVRVTATLRVDAPGLAGNLAVLQVRDAADRLVWEIYISDEDGTLRLWSPPGGLRAEAINMSSRVRIALDGTRPRTVAVVARAGAGVVVSVDGRTRIRLQSLTPAATGRQRRVRVGIVAYGGDRAVGPVAVVARAIRVAAPRR